jgi:hypothetical protein
MKVVFLFLRSLLVSRAALALKTWLFASSWQS